MPTAFLSAATRARAWLALPLMLLPAVESIRLRGGIDEEALRLLVHLVYDVRRDDIQL